MLKFISMMFSVLFIGQLQAQGILDDHNLISFELSVNNGKNDLEIQYSRYATFAKNDVNEVIIKFHYEIMGDGNWGNGVSDIVSYNYTGASDNTYGMSRNKTTVKLLSDTEQEFSLEETMNNKVVKIYKISKLSGFKYLLTVINGNGEIEEVYTQYYIR